MEKIPSRGMKAERIPEQHIRACASKVHSDWLALEMCVRAYCHKNPLIRRLFLVPPGQSSRSGSTGERRNGARIWLWTRSCPADTSPARQTGRGGGHGCFWRQAHGSTLRNRKYPLYRQGGPANETC